MYFRSVRLYPHLVAPLLFRKEAEDAHHWIANWMEKAGRSRILSSFIESIYAPSKAPELSQTIFGRVFPHPIGIAAGFDKDAKTYKALTSLGFSFVEIGTVTPKPQAGNDRPRMFRLTEDKALINRLGFNNGGAEEAAKRLVSRENRVIGGNIGKNKSTPNESALDDYLESLNTLHPYVDYFTVNVSSPNTPGLRELQEKAPLKKLLEGIQHKNQAYSTPRPILLKIAPDMNDDQLEDIAEVVKDTGMAGMVTTNTTIGRDGLRTKKETVDAIGAGGLSGAPLRFRSTQVVKKMRDLLGKDAVIIGVGGVGNGRDVIEKLSAGANLVQVYTGFVYAGPSMVKDCIQEMQHGLRSNHWAWPHRMTD